MKRTMGMTLVLALLAAGLVAQPARAQDFHGEPGLPADASDDIEADLRMAHGGIGHVPGMAAHARGMRHGRMGRAHGLGLGLRPWMAEELNLTAEQREKMKATHERQERKAIQTRADIQLARMDLRKLMQAEKPDQRAIDAQIDKIASLRSGLEKSRVATMLEVRAALTPEQQKKLRELREQGPRRARPSSPQRQGGGGDI